MIKPLSRSFRQGRGLYRGFIPSFYPDTKPSHVRERYWEPFLILRYLLDPSACLEAKSGGFCRGSIPSFYYNAETKSCEVKSFSWSVAWYLYDMVTQTILHKFGKKQVIWSVKAFVYIELNYIVFRHVVFHTRAKCSKLYMIWNMKGVFMIGDI